jgi:2-hydroxychromene-2-carboxylate isomerase
MKPESIEFYFDFVSPYAYLASRQIGQLCARHGVQLVPRPVVYGALLDHWGLTGPAEVPPRREWLFKDCLRHASLLGVAFHGPAAHPFRSLTALRAALPEASGQQQAEVIEALWQGAWARGLDLGRPEGLTAALEAAGLEAKELLARTELPEVKAALRRETDAAIARGVFGVPTMIAGAELFWGNDRLAHLELYLEGRDPLDRERLAQILARPRGADRKTVSPTR